MALRADKYVLYVNNNMSRTSSKKPGSGSILKLFSHDLNHNPGPQLKAILEQQAFCHGLMFTNSIRVTKKEFFLIIRHGSQKFFFIPDNQTENFIVFSTGCCIVLGRFNIPLPQFF